MKESCYENTKKGKGDLNKKRKEEKKKGEWDQDVKSEVYKIFQEKHYVKRVELDRVKIGVITD